MPVASKTAPDAIGMSGSAVRVRTSPATTSGTSAQLGGADAKDMRVGRPVDRPPHRGRRNSPPTGCTQPPMAFVWTAPGLLMATLNWMILMPPPPPPCFLPPPPPHFFIVVRAGSSSTVWSSNMVVVLMVVLLRVGADWTREAERAVRMPRQA